MKRVYMTFVEGLERIFGGGGVLAYHGVGDAPELPELHVSVARLKSQLELLRENYRVIPLVELVARIERGRSIRGCVAVSFDDAYLGVARASDLLEELATPVTVFVASGAALSGAPYWWDLLPAVSARGSDEDWEALLKTVGLGGRLRRGDPEAASRLQRHIQIELKGVPDALVERLAHLIAPTVWRSASFEELDALARKDLVDFGVHTVRHPALPLLSREEQLREIASCHDTLRARLPRVRPLVAYPYGFFDAATTSAAREAGMTAGFSTVARAPLRADRPLAIPRLCAAEATEERLLVARLGFPHAMAKRAMPVSRPWLDR